MTLILLLILLIYMVTMAQLIVGFDKIKTFHSKAIPPKTFFAIVVPFRNESSNLPILLESIKNLNLSAPTPTPAYPLPHPPTCPSESAFFHARAAYTQHDLQVGKEHR